MYGEGTLANETCQLSALTFSVPLILCLLFVFLWTGELMKTTAIQV